MTVLVLPLALLTLVYFAVLNGLSLAFTAIAWTDVTRHLRLRSSFAAHEAFASPLTPGISLLLPAFNEEAGVVESVRSLLALRYPRLEVVVVNDGSTDSTVARLVEAFELVPVRKVIRDGIETKPLRASYVSRRNPNLIVVDKENGGKADALNCGVNAAIHPYVCAIDADALIEPDALLHVAAPIFRDPDRVAATGGVVRVANGCTIDHGRVIDVRLPSSRVATLQVVEYFRAFLVGRVGWSRLNALLIISGAFGLFRRSLVEAVGGYWTETVGEDVELVVRLHRYLRDRDEPYTIAFVPDPVCWTEAPEDLRSLSRQRRRWQRGLGQTIWRHRRVLGNPRYRLFGLLAFPYFAIFELFGPVIQVVGPVATIYWWAEGRLSTLFFVCFLIVTFLLGILLSVAALALEEFSFQRHPRTHEILRLAGYSIIENLGYRQLNDVWRTLALVDLARRRKGWGAQKRRGIGQAASP